MKCVECGWSIHECICKECTHGLPAGYEIVPSQVGEEYFFDLQNSRGDLVKSYCRRAKAGETEYQVITAGLREARQKFM